MGKRILLFLATNLAIVFVLTIVISVLGVGRYVGRGGLDLGALATLCFVWGMGGAFLSLQLTRWMAKRAYNIRVVDGHTGNDDADWTYRTVARLTQQAHLPMPEVGIYESAEVNAFATGASKSRSLVAVSTGLLQSMRRDEAEGVLGHEVTHIANGDMVTMALLQGVINAFVMFLSRVIAYAIASRGNSREDRSPMLEFMLIMVLQIVFGALGMLVVCWFSRQREFRADRGGAQLTGRDHMLAALRRLAGNQDRIETRQHQELAAFKISGKWSGLLSTHPPLDVRIAALEKTQL